MDELVHDKLFIAICLIVALLGIIHWMHPKPKPVNFVAQQNGEAITGKTVEVKPTGVETLGDKNNHDDNAFGNNANTASTDETTFVQSSGTGCVITNPQAVKQSDGTVVARFQVSGVNATPGQNIYVQITSPNIEPDLPGQALSVHGKAPLITDTNSAIQPGVATATMHPSEGTFYVETKLSAPGKIGLDCKVM